eukprot:TRINITY_DN63576_c0_g1_i1.p1 TRINITY_DN63576_c0_g1~~TRINITY_DN63576_c0_g1_i1.p1  ORF type:complete len:515 (-),score=59.67 TRINITY_DN63576_c0_g1_i1:98-1573(-)
MPSSQMLGVLVLNSIAFSVLATSCTSAERTPQEASTASMLQQTMKHSSHVLFSKQGDSVKKWQRGDSLGSAPGWPVLSMKTSLCAWSCFGLIALTWEIYRLYVHRSVHTHALASESGRDRRWDAAKFVFMALVVMNHINGYVLQDWFSPAQNLISRLHIPGFSFVSGVFAAGSPLVEHGNSVTLHFNKLGAWASDLALLNVTMLPLNILWFSDVHKFWNNPRGVSNGWLFHYWYLNSLLAWQLTLPLICLARKPILSALAVSVLVAWNEEKEDEIPLMDNETLAPNKTTRFYVFFVAGFVLAGGGLATEQRRAKRKALEDQLANRKVLWGSIAVLMLTLAAMNQDFWPTPWSEVFQEPFHRNLFGWQEYGPLAQAGHVGWTFVVMLAALAVIFAIPFPPLIGDAGSRTLFVYVLHELFIYSGCGDALKNLAVASSFEKSMVVAPVAVIVSVVLGSSLVETVSSPFVRPRWLLKLLICPVTSEKCSNASDAR